MLLERLGLGSGRSIGIKYRIIQVKVDFKLIPYYISNI